MTTPPLPEDPCLRVRLDYTQTDGFLGGNRLFLAYAGSAPSGANCTTLAGDVAAAWETHLAGVVSNTWALSEVDVLDIASDLGLSGQWTGSNAGTQTGTALPAQSATNVEFDIARRYRGGKPRIYLPPGTQDDIENPSKYTTSFIDAVNTAFAAFISEITALSIGSVGALSHVNLSYYKGFTNITNSSGRTRAVPTYRSEALVDAISGYSCKQTISSQRRRRLATTY